jgi:hypothetical protein
MESHYAQINGYGYNGQRFNLRTYKNKSKSNSTNELPTNMQEKLPSTQQELQNKYNGELRGDSPHFASNNQIKQEVDNLTELIKKLMDTHLDKKNTKDNMEDCAKNKSLSITDILLIIIIVIIFIAFIFIPFLGCMTTRFQQEQLSQLKLQLQVNDK